MPPVAAAAVAVAGSIAAGVVGATTALGIAIGVGSTVLSTVIGVVGQRKAGKRPATRAAAVPVTVRQPISFRQRLYGRKRIGGQIIHLQLMNNNNGLLIAGYLSEGVVNGPRRVFFDDEVIWERNPGTETFSDDLANHGTYNRGWGEWVKIEFRRGDQTTAINWFADQSTANAQEPTEDNVSATLTAPTGVTLTAASVEKDVIEYVVEPGEGRVERATTENVTEYTVSWNAATGGTVSSYRVSYTDARGARSTIEVDGAETSVVIGTAPDIAPSEAEVTVAAVDAGGDFTAAVDENDVEQDRSPGWTRDYVGAGVAYFAARLTWDPAGRRWPNGVPNITFDMEGCREVFDPRDSSTGYSDNPALCLRHYLLDDTLNKGAVDQTQVDASSFIAQANLCDELVDTPEVGVQEKRYRMGGLVVADERADETIPDICASMASDLIWSTGVLKLVNGQIPAATYTMTDDDLVGPHSFDAGRGLEGTYNAIQGSYAPEETDFTTTSYPLRKDDTAIAEDGAQRTRTLDLPFTPTAGMAERLADAVLREGRKKRFFEGGLPMTALALDVGDTVSWTSAQYGFSAALFRVDGISVALSEPADGSEPQPFIRVRMSEADAEQFQINQGDLIKQAAAPRAVYPKIFVQPPTNVLYEIQPGIGPVAQGAPSLLVMDVTWTASTSEDVIGYEVFYRYNGFDYVYFTATTYAQLNRPGTLVRVRALARNNRFSALVPATQVGDVGLIDTTPPPVPTSSALNTLSIDESGQPVLRLDPSPASDFGKFRIYAAPAGSYGDVPDTGTNTEYVTSLYEFYFDRSPDAAGLAFWVGQLDGGATRETVAGEFASSFENAPLLSQSDTNIIVLRGLARGIQYTIYATAVDIRGNESAEFDAGAITVEASVAEPEATANLLDLLEYNTSWTFGPNEVARVVQTTGAITGTIETNANVATSSGYNVELVNTDTANDLTIMASAGVTLNGVSGGSCILPAPAAGDVNGATLWKYGAEGDDTWRIGGANDPVS